MSKRVRRRLFRWAAATAYFGASTAVALEVIYLDYERFGVVPALIVTGAVSLLFAAPVVLVGARYFLTRAERAIRLCSIMWLVPALILLGRPSTLVITLAVLFFLADAGLGVLGMLSCLVWTGLERLGRKGSGSAGHAGDTR